VRAHWNCPHGHHVKTEVGTYVRSGCYLCKRSRHEMLDHRPSLLAEWDFSANTLSLWGIPSASNKEAAWVCQKGHTWSARIDARTIAGTRCPGCHGKKLMPGINDFRTIHPTLAAEWHPWNNGPNGLEHFTAKSHRDVWWRCGAGHVRKEKIAERLERGGCLDCRGSIRSA
jgi:hypothetical protein